MNPVIRNIIRTAVPAIVGAATGYLAKHGFNTSSTTAMVIMPIATTAYYSAIRIAEAKYPKLAWLLGALPQPKPVAPVEAPVAK
jgi:hypothetical protein